MQPASIPNRRENLHVREIDGETVILDQENERMHNLNSTAAFVFLSVDGQRTERQIGEEFAECFGVTLQVAEQDTQAALRKFRELQLIR